MRKAAIAFLCLLLVFTGVAVAENPPEGGIIGTGETPRCAECSRDLEFAYCDSTQGFDRQRWADCKGGQICYWDGQYWQCEPDCGGYRCYLV